MNKEERKEYNKKYYSVNKTVIIEKYYKTKINCEFCSRLICVANLGRHHDSALCRKRSIKKQEIKQRLQDLETLNPNKNILNL
jgi:hypothetical protein